MEELIRHCRYYKGEKECPESIETKGMANVWFYEKIWVESDEFRNENGYNAMGYISDGLKDFNPDDGTPFTLKSLLYNRYTHWCGGYAIESDTKNFKEWYESNYIGKTR